MKTTAAPLHPSLPECLLLTSEIYADHRGVFLEGYREDLMTKIIGVPCFVQGNVSVSLKGVLRGLHYQIVAPQGKLMRIVHGATMNAVVDMRQGSPTFGRAAWTRLDRPEKALWVPPGFANGFLALNDHTVVAYECSTYYRVGSDRGVFAGGPFTCDAPDDIIPWNLSGRQYNMSDKDIALPRLDTAEPVPESEWRR